jgi:hypothetical protein
MLVLAPVGCVDESGTARRIDVPPVEAGERDKASASNPERGAVSTPGPVTPSPPATPEAGPAEGTTGTSERP